MIGVALRDRLPRLRQSLADRLGDRTIEVEPYRAGVDCWVDRVRRADHLPAVVRSAKVEQSLTRYDGLVDFGANIPKEVAAARLLGEAGVPTPAVLHWHRSADPLFEPSWMLLQLIEHAPADHLEPEIVFQLGQLAARIHSIRPSGSDLILFGRTQPWVEWIQRRITTRIKAAGTYMSVPPPTEVASALELALRDREPHAGSLLHLDLRPPNLAIRDGHIRGLLDLGNVTIGDPYLELARLRGCNLLSSAFLAGYGAEPSLLELHDAALGAYELDLTALLVVVSREEFDDPRLHAQMVARTAILLKRLIGVGRVSR